MSDTKSMPEAGSHVSKEHGCCGGEYTKDNKADPAKTASRTDTLPIERTVEPAKHHDSGECCCGSKQIKG